MRVKDPRRFPRLRPPALPREATGNSASKSPEPLPGALLGEIPGETLELSIGPVAHGGHCIARISDGPDAGRVVFVRHALPGEKVLARITDRGKIWRADAVDVLDNPSPYRVPSAWPEAGPDGVGGGELAHVSPAGERLWKAAVITEQMRRLAGVDVSQLNPNLAISALTLQPFGLAAKVLDSATSAQNDGESLTVKGLDAEVMPPSAKDENPVDAVKTEMGVEPAVDWPVGAGYRTRIDLVVEEDGRVGMRKARSHDVVALADMPLATPQLREFAKSNRIWDKNWPPNSRVTIVAPNHPKGSNSGSMVLVDGKPTGGADAGDWVQERVWVDGGWFNYQVAPDGFWQVHAKAPETLVAAVLAAAGDLEARRVLELYSGAGLFTLPLAAGIGSHGKLTTIEGAKTAVEFAKQNLENLRDQLGRKALPKAQQLAGSVHQNLTKLLKLSGIAFDLVVVDPPREGLEKGVVEQLAQFSPSRIVYISCDPAALARDTARLIQNGYQLTGLRAFDLFPMTHHVETVAVLEANQRL